MSYAIIKSGGKQHRVAVGDLIDVELLNADLDESVEFETLFVYNGKESLVGLPLVANYTVRGKVVDFAAGPKIQSVKYKKRKRSYKKWGHRQHYSRIEITAIEELQEETHDKPKKKEKHHGA